VAELELSPATILVADDNWVNLELLSELLQAQGYRVICVVDGEQALEALAAQQIDLALLDVIMPRRTGFDVCRAIRSKRETRLIPVVLVTSSTDTSDHIQGIECGADDFLNKPVNKAELLARVRSLLRLKQFTDELESAETVLFSLALSIEAKIHTRRGTATACQSIRWPWPSTLVWPRSWESRCVGPASCTILASWQCQNTSCLSLGR